VKKIVLLLGIATLVLIQPVSGICEDDAFTKVGRGMANIFTSPGELYTQTLLLAKDNEASVAIFGGIFKGVGIMLARQVVGIYEVLTFPFAIPEGYRPIIQPATTFTDWTIRQS
jgi:putative exosortase-associated protein (TIGR04073 family)